MNAAAELLADYLRRGVHLHACGDRLKVDAPEDALTGADMGQLKARKAELLDLLRPGSAIVAYRDALRTVWALMAAGADADPDECRRARDAVVRLEAEVGEPRATGHRHGWERDWWTETARCPGCGGPGDFHGEATA